MRFSEKLALIVVTLWVGALWAIGYIAAPTLFYVLQNPITAGALAGQMFKVVAYLGMVSAFFLLIQRVASAGAQALKQS
jgi:hypothetical protein